MKIAIISDTHDNVPNLEKALKWMKENQIEQIFHCGDLCAPSMIIKTLGPNFPGTIHMVFGNVEDRELTPLKAKDFPQIRHYGDMGEVEVAGKKIAFVHFPDKAKELAKSGSPRLAGEAGSPREAGGEAGSPRLGEAGSPREAGGEAGSPRLGEAGKYDLVFYGHNHTPWEEKVGKTRLINPGTLAGMFAKATFAVYNTENDELELKILEKL